MGELFWRFGDKRDALDLVRARGHLWGVNVSQLVMMDQTHSAKVKVVSKDDFGSGFVKPALPVVDAICTDMQDVLLVVKGADCVPILFYDSVHMVVAAAHSGRVGTQSGICKRVLEKLDEVYGCKASDMQVMIGAGVSAEHYQVSQEIYQRFVQDTGVSQPLVGHLDLRKVIVADLLQSGVRQENLQCSSECTFLSERYFSYRQDKSCGRQLAAIGVLNGTVF